jgi:hypothetical protein
MHKLERLAFGWPEPGHSAQDQFVLVTGPRWSDRAIADCGVRVQSGAEAKPASLRAVMVSDRVASDAE